MGEPLRVFISYSHDDRKFKDELLAHLKVFERFHGVRFWTDEHTEPGAGWLEELDNAMREADVALLLVSRSLLSSQFINDVEIPKLVRRHAEEGLSVIPILLRQCSWKSHPEISQFSPLPSNEKPISAHRGDAKERAYTEVADAIATLVKKRAKQYSSPLTLNEKEHQVSIPSEGAENMPYALLTRAIFEEFLRQETANTISVEHDVMLKGRSANHRIDVSWEFEVGGIKYRTLVQCRDLATPVDQGELLKFKAVLDDIPGQPRGVFVTRAGYQSGALDVAKSNGIIVYELRQPTARDFGGIHTIAYDLRIFEPHLTGVKMGADIQWLAEERRLRGISDTMNIAMNLSDFEDEHGNVLLNVSELINAMIPEESNPFKVVAP
jgi:hypothetical protein